LDADKAQALYFQVYDNWQKINAISGALVPFKGDKHSIISSMGSSVVAHPGRLQANEVCLQDCLIGIMIHHRLDQEDACLYFKYISVFGWKCLNLILC
jgi:regulatory protein YycI of two-component signal transduction system YycFG